LVAAGDVSVVLAQDRDRFAREPAYHYLLRKEFEEYGCRLKALNDRGDNSPEGELTDGILDQLAKFERAKMAKRTRRGRLRKVREGKLVGNGMPDYGFRYNERRDGYEIDQEAMLVVERVLQMVGEEDYSIHGVVDALNREGLSAPRGGRWNRTFVRKLILDDVYRAHSYQEVALLVSPEVAERLDPEGHYGVFWYNRVRRRDKQVSEVRPSGERVYRTRSTTTPKPREEWIAVPVPHPGIPRATVDAARRAIKDNKKTSSAGSRFWELSGGVARCKECGRALTPQTLKRKKRGKVDYYYRCLGHWHEGACSNKKHHRAEDLELRVASGVASLFGDRDTLLSHIDERIRQETESNPEREAIVWTKRIAALDRKISRAQDLAIEGLISHDDLRERLAGMRREKETAKRELEAVKNKKEHIEELKSHRRYLLDRYAAGLALKFRYFPPDERHRIYKKLGLMVRVGPDGTLEIEGTFDVNVLPNDAMVAYYCSAWAQVMSTTRFLDDAPLPPTGSTPLGDFLRLREMRSREKAHRTDKSPQKGPDAEGDSCKSGTSSTRRSE
jgi:site-specific DNA recombinase